MELLTPLVQATESPSDSHASAHTAPAADSTSEPEEFDTAVYDDGAGTAETEAPASEPVRAEHSEEHHDAGRPPAEMIEELMNRWSGVTGAFREKPPAENEHQYLPAVETPVETPVEPNEFTASESEVVVVNDSEITADDTIGEVSQPDLPEIQLAEAETDAKTDQNQALPLATVKAEKNAVDEAPESAADDEPAVAEKTLRAVKAGDEPVSANGKGAGIPDSGEVQGDDQPQQTNQQTAAPKNQAAAAAAPQDISAASQNTKPIDLTVLPREAAAALSANPVSEGRVTSPAPPVNRQIADAIITASDKMVEIRLSPEELGKVRMILTGQDRAPHLTIWVERPETLEQMRRNSAGLLQDLHEAGMTDATLDFRDGGRGQTGSQADRASRAQAEEQRGPTLAENTLTRRLGVTNYMLPASRGIDIRV